MLRSKHIFSDAHVSAGIEAMGANRGEIISSVSAVISKFSKLFVNGNNTIYTTINGVNAVVKANVQNGVVRSVNAYVDDVEQIIYTVKGQIKNTENIIIDAGTK